MRTTPFILLVLAALPACSIRDAQTAATARTSLVGLSQEQLSLCAGLPAKTERVDPRTELRSYEAKADDAKALSLNFPVIGGGVNLGSGGNCKVTFKLVDGHVQALGFAGDTDSGPGGIDAVCAPVVRHCLQDLPVAARG